MVIACRQIKRVCVGCTWVDWYNYTRVDFFVIKRKKVADSALESKDFSSPIFLCIGNTFLYLSSVSFLLLTQDGNNLTKH